MVQPRKTAWFPFFAICFRLSLLWSSVLCWPYPARDGGFLWPFLPCRLHAFRRAARVFPTIHSWLGLAFYIVACFGIILPLRFFLVLCFFVHLSWLPCLPTIVILARYNYSVSSPLQLLLYWFWVCFSVPHLQRQGGVHPSWLVLSSTFIIPAQLLNTDFCASFLLTWSPTVADTSHLLIPCSGKVFGPFHF